jgi:hypothetical protein
MVFLITQEHTPESCPKDTGGSKTLYDANAEGVTLKAMYGAFSDHVIYYVVEASDLSAVHKFLDPGWLRCSATVTPVAEEPIVR